MFITVTNKIMVKKQVLDLNKFLCNWNKYHIKEEKLGKKL